MTPTYKKIYCEMCGFNLTDSTYLIYINGVLLCDKCRNNEYKYNVVRKDT